MRWHTATGVDDCSLDGVPQWLSFGRAADVAVPAARWRQFQSLRSGAVHLPHDDAPWPERCGMTAVQAPDTSPQWLLLDMPGAPQAGVPLKTPCPCPSVPVVRRHGVAGFAGAGSGTHRSADLPGPGRSVLRRRATLARLADVQRGAGVDIAGAFAAHAHRLVQPASPGLVELLQPEHRQLFF